MKVKITKKQSAWVGAPIIFEQTVEADSWISIVASMTIEGQIASTQKVLELLHLGKPFLNTSEDKP